VTESDEIPQAGTVWHCRLNVNMVEDRQEANLTLGADARPRHELRAENISALLFGVWKKCTLALGTAPTLINPQNNNKYQLTLQDIRSIFLKP
jgi:hypothetical protein